MESFANKNATCCFICTYSQCYRRIVRQVQFRLHLKTVCTEPLLCINQITVCNLIFSAAFVLNKILLTKNCLFVFLYLRDLSRRRNIICTTVVITFIKAFARIITLLISQSYIFRQSLLVLITKSPSHHILKDCSGILFIRIADLVSPAISGKEIKNHGGVRFQEILFIYLDICRYLSLRILLGLAESCIVLIIFTIQLIRYINLIERNIHPYSYLG